MRFGAPALLAISLGLITACAMNGPGVRPAAERMAADVAKLDAVIPVVEALHVTYFENGPQCRVFVYALGAFNAGEPGCERDQTGPFPPEALADHARVALAIDVSGVATRRLRHATYGIDGRLETAYFDLDGSSILDSWEYLYDPTDVVPKVDREGVIDFTQIAPAWWFVWTPDD